VANFAAGTIVINLPQCSKPAKNAGQTLPVPKWITEVPLSLNRNALTMCWYVRPIAADLAAPAGDSSRRRKFK
jgi:hypothetical protein